MPLLSGIKVTQELKNIAPGAAVVICSVETDQKLFRRVNKLGPWGYVVKIFAARDLAAALELLLVASLFSRSDDPRSSCDLPICGLTRRQVKDYLGTFKVTLFEVSVPIISLN